MLVHTGCSPAQGAREWTRMLASWADRQQQKTGTPLLDAALPEFEKTLIELALQGRAPETILDLGTGLHGVEQCFPNGRCRGSPFLGIAVSWFTIHTVSALASISPKFGRKRNSSRFCLT